MYTMTLADKKSLKEQWLFCSSGLLHKVNCAYMHKYWKDIWENHKPLKSITQQNHIFIIVIWQNRSKGNFLQVFFTISGHIKNKQSIINFKKSLHIPKLFSNHEFCL